jgi:hypothetical protein
MESDMGGVPGTRGNPWVLKTPGDAVSYVAFRDPAHTPPSLVVRVEGAEIRYHLRCLNDLDEMLKAHRDWIPLGSAGEQKPAAEGTVEAWARSAGYGLTKGRRGWFALYIPPIMQALTLAEIDEKLLRMRTI